MKTYRDLVADAKRAVPEVTRGGRARAGSPGARPSTSSTCAIRTSTAKAPSRAPCRSAAASSSSRCRKPSRIPRRRSTLYCLSGLRSLLAGKVLHDLGYTNVTSMAGGIRRWKELKLPLVKDQPLTADQMERYSRHFMLTQVGEPGQKAAAPLEGAPDRRGRASARRPRSTSPRRASARSASSTTTSWTCRTSSARSSTGRRTSAGRRSSPRATRSPRSTPT